MNTRRRFSSLASLALLVVASAHAQAPLGTAFTYQGRLSDAGAPANGNYDLQFSLFAVPSGGASVAGPLTFNIVAVTQGVFTVRLDFGAQFGGDARYLEVGVKPAGSGGGYTVLAERQELTPTPNALFAASSATVTESGVNTAQLADGAVTALKLGPGAVTAGAIAGGEVVRSLNGLADHVTIAGSGGTTVSTAGDTITIGTAGPPADCTVPGTVVLGVAGDTTLIGAGYKQLATMQEVWTPTATTPGVPSARTNHTAVWTGSRMIVWGGFGDGTYINTGGQYDPVANSWSQTATTLGVPSPRRSHTAVWTGSKMILWGGYDGSSSLNTGGQYDPVGNSWSATATTPGVPSGRQGHTAVWSGSRMIVWAGTDGAYFNTGGQYDPVGNAWTATATTLGVPSGRYAHAAVWTGAKMIAWGGFDGTNYLNTGGQYDPVGNSWTATAATAGVPSGRTGFKAVWTGSKMIVWGGNGGPLLNTGGQFDPSVGGPEGSWTSTDAANAPSARFEHTAVWTGSKMIVWGGIDGSYSSTGGQYDPARNSWAPTATTAGVPSGRYGHTAVWTGSKMIVWGGSEPSLTNTGAQWFVLSYFIKN